MEMPTTSDLLNSIELFLGRHGDMAETRFGREATGEPQLIASMRRGRSPSLDTAGRITAYMRFKDGEVPAHAAGGVRQPAGEFAA